MLAATEFSICVFRHDNDFLWHRNFGVSFLRNQVYDTFGYHYLPARAMIDAATAWMPYRLDRAIWLLGTSAILVLCVRFWSRVVPLPPGEVREITRAASSKIISRQESFAPRRYAVATASAVVVTASYIHRDLVECGLQLFLLGLLTAALAALVRGRPSLCGLTLGLATVYKVMPVIFFPLLLWKRRWRAAAWMAASILFFCLLPTLRVGWQKNLALHRQWLDFAGRLVALDDPSENGVERPNLRNQSLPLVLARLVEKYPSDHPLNVDELVHFRLASLDPPQAKRIVQVALLALVIGLAWCFRGPVDLSDGAEALAREWAGACILVALLSPLCWLQHLVLVIPAAILFAQSAASGKVRQWQWAAAAIAAALMLLVHRDLLGPTLCDILSICQPHTAASLLIGAAALSSTRPVDTESFVILRRDLRQAA
jgi:hypothetical protein